MIRNLSLSAQAIAIAFLAYASFSHSDVLAKILTRTYSVQTCLTFGGLVGLFICTVWIYLGKGWQGFKPPKWKIHLLRACVVACSANFAIGAIKFMPLPAFYGVIFVAPIAMVIVATLLRHEPFRPHRLITMGMGFAGVLVIVGTQFERLGAGSLLALGCVACSIVSVMMVRKIGKDDYLPVYGFFPFLMITLFCAPFADWHLREVTDAFMFLAFGMLILMGHICIPLAYGRAPQTSLVAPIYYTQMLWGTLYGYLFFKQIPTLNTLTGAALIIGGGLLMIWIERRRPRAIVNTGVSTERE